jgi:hypothetical protein
VIECVPTASAVDAKVAEPPLMIPVKSVVAPSLNVTLPVALAGDTAAVNVTFTPRVDGFNDDVRVVVVEIGFTIWVSTEDVLVRLVASPP